MDVPSVPAWTLEILVCPDGHVHLRLRCRAFVADSAMNLTDALALQNALNDVLNDPNIEWNTDYGN